MWSLGTQWGSSIDVLVCDHLGVIEAGDNLDILLEYCDSGALRNYVELGSPQIPSLLAVLRDVISALVFMHTARFAHLDIKPHNILVKSEDAPWLKLPEHSAILET